ncbi:uncharacterized protein LOC129309005 [Prosopis cineraria]|uniref:uncharacterized protein LOC129309005 n=1 Tax=Prosopis cineraria TaxID=364024 RepID=UPI00240EE3A9|nr:uncharacterized protein LOC129309005 [Prosopis cineraria]
MLRRSWSSLPTYGLHRRDASTVDRRSKRRSKSLSGRETNKELSMLGSYERQHQRRLAKRRTLRAILSAILELKNSILDDLEARFQRIIEDPSVDIDEGQRVREHMCKEIVEGIRSERENELIASITALGRKEEEFLNKLEIIRTMQLLQVGGTNEEPETESNAES